MKSYRRAAAPPHVRPILEAFTDEELDKLSINFAWETGEFLGIGFISEDTGKMTKFANLGKAAAVLVLEDIVRKELYGRT